MDGDRCRGQAETKVGQVLGNGLRAPPGRRRRAMGHPFPRLGQPVLAGQMAEGAEHGSLGFPLPLGHQLATWQRRITYSPRA